MPDRFSAGLTPLPTAARVTRQRGALRWRIGSTVVSALILGAVIYFLGRDWPPAWTYTFVGLWVASSAFWLTVSAVGLYRANFIPRLLKPRERYAVCPVQAVVLKYDNFVTNKEFHINHIFKVRRYTS